MSQKARRSDASVLPGAKPAPFPGFVAPCHPALPEKAPSDARWIHEIKFDGYRTQAHTRHGKPAIYTRAGYDWTRRFQPIADALAKLPATELILDGEAVVADSRGIPDFGLLHADLAAGRKDRLIYYAFDLLYLDGFDLRGVRLADRKRVLAELLAGAVERILYAEHLEGSGAEIYQRACAMGLEGIVSKQQDTFVRRAAGTFQDESKRPGSAKKRKFQSVDCWSAFSHKQPLLPFPNPVLPKGLHPHPALWALRQRHSRRDHRARISRPGSQTWRRSSPSRPRPALDTTLTAAPVPGPPM
jgi:hypothetical protein